jgi:hypothetical protein
MGNISDAEIKSNTYQFAISVETSYISCAMTKDMVMKWRELGKPLFLIPKDFKERILTSSMDQEVKLNYLKWLTQGVEIDMFELLSLLILYARGSLEERLSVLFMLYCYEDDESM